MSAYQFVPPIPTHPFLSEEANARLDWHWREMNRAEKAADSFSYMNEQLNHEVGIATEAYTAAEDREYSRLILQGDSPSFQNHRICDVLPQLELEAEKWKQRHPTGYKLALQAVERHKQALAEREAKINALTANKPRLSAIVAERETSDDGQWANWDESSPMLGIDW
jgi:hypothetical protein